jgi:hypothetical protein
VGAAELRTGTVGCIEDDSFQQTAFHGGGHIAYSWGVALLSTGANWVVSGVLHLLFAFSCGTVSHSYQ